MVLSNLKPGHTMAGDWRRLAKVKYCDSNRVFCMMRNVSPAGATPRLRSAVFGGG